MFNASAYRKALQDLLPTGAAWPRRPDAVLTRLLDSLAQSMARVDRRASELVAESIPDRTTELLSEWERMAGLPDPCSGPADGLEARRAQLVQRLTSRGGQSPAYFIQLAATLGYTITITEFQSFTCQSYCDASLDTDPWRHTWRVDAPAVTVIEMSCESGCDEAIRTWGNEPLECLIRRLRPAHTHVLFGYGD